MTLSLLLAGVWALLVNILAASHGKDRPSRTSYGLVALGIPIVGLVTWQHGPWLGMFLLAAGSVVLRWPLAHLGRRARSKAVR